MGIPTLFHNICRHFMHLYCVNTRNTSILLRDVGVYVWLQKGIAVCVASPEIKDG